MDKELIQYEKRKIRQLTRLIRVSFAITAYSKYARMETKRQLLKCENTWESAESTKKLIGLFFPDREVKTEEFIHDKDELTNKVIELHKEYQMFLSLSSNLKVPKCTIDAFCKSVEFGDKVYFLKSLGQVYYPDYLLHIHAYIQRSITKEQLQKSLVEYSIFTGGCKKADLRFFRKTLIETERLLNEIQEKQIARKQMTVDEILESEKENVNAPF